MRRGLNTCTASVRRGRHTAADADPRPAGRRVGGGAAAPRRAFTLVEATVTLALMLVLLAVTFPQLTAAAALGGDQQAKMSANAVLDAVATTYGRTTSQLPWDTVTVGNSTVHVPPRPSVDPALVATLAPDVTVLPRPTDAAAGQTQVSVATKKMTDGTAVWWRTGAAAYASAGGRRTCWLMWADVDPPASSTPTSRYLVFDASNDTEAGLCTGHAAVNLTNAPTGADAAGTGSTWTLPLPVDAASMTTAAAAAS